MTTPKAKTTTHPSTTRATHRVHPVRLIEQINAIFDEGSTMSDAYDRVSGAIRSIFDNSDNAKIRDLTIPVNALIDQYHSNLCPWRTDDTEILRMRNAEALYCFRHDLTELITQFHLTDEIIYIPETGNVDPA